MRSATAAGKWASKAPAEPATKLSDLFVPACLITAALAMVPLWIGDPRLAIVPPVCMLLLMMLIAAGAGAFVPRDKIGWLYVVIIISTTVAPSLGGVGSVIRTALAVLVATVVANLYLRRRRRHSEIGLPAVALTGLTLLGAALTISLLGAPSFFYGVTRGINWIMYVPLMFLSFRRPSMSGVAFGIVAASAIQMLGVFLQVVGMMGGTWGGLLTSGTTYNPLTSTWLTRFTGFVLNPNNLALILALGSIVMTATLFGKSNLRAKFVCVALLFLFVAGIVMSGSRGGLIALVLGLAVVSCGSGWRGCLFGSVALSAAVLTTTHSRWGGLTEVMQSLAQIASGTDLSASQRNAVWIERLSSVSATDLYLGVGFGGYDGALFADQTTFNVSVAAARAATVDSAWIKLVLESGMLGAVGIALIYLSALSTVFATRPGHKLVCLGLTGALLALLWRSLSVDMLDQNPWNAILFLIMGSIFAVRRPSATGDLSRGVPLGNV